VDEVRFFGNESDLPRLKALRAERGWSVRRLAQEANLSPATVNEIELGKRRAQDGTVAKLTEALGVGRAELIFTPEQVRVWRDQDEAENTLLAQRLASLTDRELRAILLGNALLNRRVTELVRREKQEKSKQGKGARRSIQEAPDPEERS
jgi:transcriptional regulator with XRE-family HTH domain